MGVGAAGTNRRLLTPKRDSDTLRLLEAMQVSWRINLLRCVSRLERSHNALLCRLERAERRAASLLR